MVAFLSAVQSFIRRNRNRRSAKASDMFVYFCFVVTTLFCCMSFSVFFWLMFSCCPHCFLFVLCLQHRLKPPPSMCCYFWEYTVGCSKGILLKWLFILFCFVKVLMYPSAMKDEA